MFSRKGFKISTGICGLLASGTVLKSLGHETESKKKASQSRIQEHKRQILIDGYELKQVQIFVRHGARTPIHTTLNVDQVKLC